ncbi:MAG: hypothetical protein K6G00_08250, partial [Treponema sp.]|nr:hypothetical protein [Treponema sp.]
MQRHPFIKLIALTMLYAVAIVGIFILQFKTDTSITRAIGDMRISLERVDSEGSESEESAALKNQLSVSFKGLSFAANDSHPAVAYASSGEKSESLVLQSFEQQDNGILLKFTDGTEIVFAVNGVDSDTSLSVSAVPAEGFDSVSIPYAVNSAYKIVSKTESAITLESKDSMFVFSAHKFDGEKMLLSKNNLLASFAPFVPEKKFEYTSLASFDSASKASYDASLSAFRNAVTTRYSETHASNAASLTEREVVAYVAEMGSRGRFVKAVSEVPLSFKNSSKRTYVSTPHIGNLVESNKKLIAKSNEFSNAVNSAIASNSISVFTEDGIADYILGQRKTEKIKTLMQIPSKKSPFTPSVMEAAGILSVYTKIRKIDEKLAASFDPVLTSCLNAIAERLKLEDNKLTFINGDVSSLQKVRIGQALIDYSRARNKAEYADTGRMIINQELSALDSLSFEAIADIYPIIVNDNKFYP